MQIKPNKSWWMLGLGVMLGAGGAYAASPRYDEAVVSIDKAAEFLNNIAETKPGATFQKARALKALERAKIRIACAKHASDTGKRGCPGARNNKFDDNDDDHDDHDPKPPKPPEHKPPKPPEHKPGKPGK